MEPEKNKKRSHTGRNVTLTALLLAALLGGHFGLGIGRGSGEGLLPQSGNSTQSETAQAQEAEVTETQEAQETQEAEAPADDGVLAIVVKEDKLYYEGREIDLAGLEQALLQDYVQGKTRVTLTDDHAIKSAYDEVAALLDRLGIAAE